MQTWGVEQGSPTTLTILRALVVARWLAWLWMLGIMVFAGGQRHPTLGWLCVAATAAFTVWSTVLARRSPERMVQPLFVGVEAALAIALSVLDGLVFEPGHVWGTTQSLATQWPLIAAITVGVAFGPLVGALYGAAIGPAEWAGAVLNDVPAFGAPEIVSLVGTSLLFAAFGGVVGWWSRQLRQAEREVADRRARDEVGRVMHDTVLQTLALVERRTAATDPELAATAREADRELRAYLFGSGARTAADLEGRVRAEVERVRRGHETPVTVSVVDDGCRLSAEHQELVARAVGEAVANALEHASARRVVVFAETDDVGHVFASIADDGVGFDPDASRDGHGLDQSIVARIESIGGRVAITSGPSGTEICLWSRGE